MIYRLTILEEKTYDIEAQSSAEATAQAPEGRVLRVQPMVEVMKDRTFWDKLKELFGADPKVDLVPHGPEEQDCAQEIEPEIKPEEPANQGTLKVQKERKGRWLPPGVTKDAPYVQFLKNKNVKAYLDRAKLLLEAVDERYGTLDYADLDLVFSKKPVQTTDKGILKLWGHGSMDLPTVRAKAVQLIAEQTPDKCVRYADLHTHLDMPEGSRSKAIGEGVVQGLIKKVGHGVYTSTRTTDTVSSQESIIVAGRVLSSYDADMFGHHTDQMLDEKLRVCAPKTDTRLLEVFGVEETSSDRVARRKQLIKDLIRQEPMSTVDLHKACMIPKSFIRTVVQGWFEANKVTIQKGSGTKRDERLLHWVN